jgi:hypothetical protein
VRTSVDLVAWTPATTILATADGTKTVDIPTGGEARFFTRVVLVE